MEEPKKVKIAIVEGHIPNNMKRILSHIYDIEIVDTPEVAGLIETKEAIHQIEMMKQYDDLRYGNLTRKEREAKIKPVRNSKKNPKIQRNDFCPCGSGKKYKHCCISNTDGKFVCDNLKTWKDIYELPFQFLDKGFKEVGWVHDQKNQFAFQFEGITQDYMDEMLKSINGGSKTLDNFKWKYCHDDQSIITNAEGLVELTYITIRGWGNLTGTGGHNLSSQEAKNVQDTLGQYIVEMLNEN